MKNILTYCGIIFLALFRLTNDLPAQNAQKRVYYDLKKLLNLAEENNKDLQLLQLELQKTKKDVEIKKSGYLPKVDAVADYYWYWGNVPLFIFPQNEGNILSGGTSAGPYPVPIGLPHNLLAGVSLSQRLFEFSYLSASKNRAVLDNLEDSRIKEKKEQLYYDVASSFYETMKLAAKKDFVHFNLMRMDRFLEILKIQVKNQMADSLQLIDLELTKSGLLLSEEEYKSGMQRKINYLKMLVGLPDSAGMVLDTPYIAPLLENIQVTEEPGENVQINLLNNAQSLNKLSQQQVRSEYLPTLDLKINLLWNAQSHNLALFSNPSYNNQVSTLGVKLDVPIYNGAAKNRKIQKLEIDRQILETQKQKLLEGFRLQVDNTQEELKFKTARYKHQHDITVLKKRVLEKETSQFEQGILPVKELLTAQSDFLEARMNEAEALYDVKLAELNYFKWSNQILTRFE